MLCQVILHGHQTELLMLPLCTYLVILKNWKWQCTLWGEYLIQRIAFLKAYCKCLLMCNGICKLWNRNAVWLIILFIFYIPKLDTPHPIMYSIIIIHTYNDTYTYILTSVYFLTDWSLFHSCYMWTGDAFCKFVNLTIDIMFLTIHIHTSSHIDVRSTFRSQTLLLVHTQTKP